MLANYCVFWVWVFIQEFPKLPKTILLTLLASCYADVLALMSWGFQISTSENVTTPIQWRWMKICNLCFQKWCQVFLEIIELVILLLLLKHTGGCFFLLMMPLYPSPLSFVKTYGYEHILTLNNLEKAGLLKPQTGSRNNYPTIRKTLKLWMEDANEQVWHLRREEAFRIKCLNIWGYKEDFALFDSWFCLFSEPQRHLVCVQWLCSTKHPTDPSPGPTGLA